MTHHLGATNFEDFNFDLPYDIPKNPDCFFGNNFELTSTPSSFHCFSSKNSYEYAQTSDFDGSDDRGSNPKSPNLLHKGIQKQHEPIVDNGLVYRYEDDPNEYKKARKRVQNRISATRVRNKKKTYVEELEGQVAALKDEIHHLKTTNNILKTENTLFKEQVSFLEKLFTNKPAQPQQQKESALDVSTFSFNETEIEIDNDGYDLNNGESPTYFRSNGGGRLRKHTAFLGVMTIVLCMYGAFTVSEEMKLGNMKAGFLGGNNQVAAYSFSKIVTRSFDTLSQNEPGKLNDSLGLTGWLILGSKLAFILIYVIYAIFVLQKIHRHYFHNKTSSTV